MMQSSAIESNKSHDVSYDLPASDREFLKELNKTIWSRTTDRFGSTHQFPDHKRPISADELNKSVELISVHKLPIILCSGPYANLSICVHDHSLIPQIEPETLLYLSENHFGLSGKPWKARFDFMSKFSHSQENKDICSFYGLSMPRDKFHYEY